MTNFLTTEEAIIDLRYEIEKEREKTTPSWLYISSCIDRIRELEKENKAQ